MSISLPAILLALSALAPPWQAAPAAVAEVPPPPAVVLLPPPPPVMPPPAASPPYCVNPPAPAAPAPPVETAPAEVPRKLFYWGIGMSGAGGIGLRSPYLMPVLHFNLDARFLIGQRLPDSGGGMQHAALLGLSLGFAVGTIVGSPSGSTWAGPLFMPHVGVDLAYQFLYLRQLQPHSKLQQGLGVAVGWHLGERFVASYLLGSGAPGGWQQSFDFANGPLIEFVFPSYDPKTGALKQRFLRFSRLAAGDDAFYMIAVGSAF
jgi:hypothetical protein